jgi:hypothetical protein
MSCPQLTEDELDLISRITLIRDVVQEAEGVIGSPLTNSQSLVEFFGFASLDEAKAYGEQLRKVANQNDAVTCALAKRRWRLKWVDDKFTLEHDGNSVEMALDKLLDPLWIVFRCKEVRWLLGGLAVGSGVAVGIFQPLLLYKLLVGGFAFALYLAPCIVAGLFLSLKLLERFPLNNCGFLTIRDLFLAATALLYLFLSITFSLWLACLLASDVEINNDPYIDDYEQVFPR